MSALPWYKIEVDSDRLLPDDQQVILDRYFGDTKNNEQGAAFLYLEGDRTMLYLTPDAQAIAMALGAKRCPKPGKGTRLTPYRGTKDNLEVD